jgi:hypothetical protein
MGVLSAIGKFRGGDARRVQRDQDGGNAARALFGRAGAREGDDALGDLVGRDRGFLAIEDVVVAVTLHLQPEIAGIRPALRFGQRDGQRVLARRQARQPVPRHFGLREIRQNLSVERGQQRHVSEGEVGLADLLDDHAGIEELHSHAAVFFRQFRRDQAQFAHLAHQLEVEGAGALAFQIARRHALLRELARKVADLLDFFGVEYRKHGLTVTG